MSTFGERFKKLRKKNKLTQDAAAKIFHVDKSAISKWENDKNGADSETLQQIANYFNVSIDYLLGISSEINPPTEKYTPDLNAKDFKKIDKVISDFEKGLEGAVMLDGEILDERTRELFIQSVRNVYEFAAQENKKFTPKKYRK